MRILVTGASGFIGRAVLNEFRDDKQIIFRAVVRHREADPIENVEYFRGGDIETRDNWATCLQEIDVVLHAAARVHVRNHEVDALQAYRRVNAAATVRIARQAADAGVRRFVYLSSIKVNGERTEPGQAFTTSDKEAPADPYAVSKYEAELGLRDLARQSALEVVIVRPPLVYGPGVKANFRTLMWYVSRGFPLPFAGVRNRRSFLALRNLTDLLRCCCQHPAAANQIFHASDGEDLSTTEWLLRIGHALGVPARLFRFPESALRTAATFMGKPQYVERLLWSMQVDMTDTCTKLGWAPPVTVDRALEDTAREFREAGWR